MNFRSVTGAVMACSHLLSLPSSASEALVLPAFADASNVPAEPRSVSDDLAPGAVVLPEAKSDLDLFAGASYAYDSNRSRTIDGSGGSVGIFDFGFDYGSGRETSRGGFYGLGYKGQFYSYEDTAFRTGQDALDHNVLGFVGINGGKTRLRMSASYSHNGGNLIDFDRSDREVRNAVSDDYQVSAEVVRDLPHGSLELGVGYAHRDFGDDRNFHDSSEPYLDAAWFYRPGFAPKTDFGLGLKIGTDDFARNLEQNYVTPSLRTRHRLSGKTSFNTSFGYEFRSTEGPGGTDVENPVYGAGLAWAATAKTSLDVNAFREVRPSHVLAGQAYETTGVTARINHKLPNRFQLSSSVGVEHADYFASRTGVDTDREDDFVRLGLNLSRGLRLFDSVDGSVGLFYNYYETESSMRTSSFEQHVTGIRFGISH